jgi:hypothetical protein
LNGYFIRGGVDDARDGFINGIDVLHWSFGEKGNFAVRCHK